MANMGGDILALVIHCVVGILLIILLESGITNLCKRRQSSANTNLDQVKDEASAGQQIDDRTKLINARNLSKTYNRRPCFCRGKSSET